MKFNSIIRIQNQLREKGYYKGGVDGIWGPSSQEALMTAVRKDGAELYFSFDEFRKFFKVPFLKQSFVDSINFLFASFNKYSSQGALNPLYVAYMLATAWHETAHTMLPIEEYGKGRGRPYGTNRDINGTYYKNIPHFFYGRGYVQLTWLTNYAYMSKKLGIDLVNNPSLALDPKHAADIMIIGMLEGSFTGKALSHYFKFGEFHEFVEARRIINGKDKASLIAGHAVKFLECVTLKF